jgi:hypothetical protein
VCYTVYRLDTGFIDLFLIHSPLAGDILRTYDAMLELKAQGLIRSVQITNNELFKKTNFNCLTCNFDKFVFILTKFMDFNEFILCRPMCVCMRYLLNCYIGPINIQSLTIYVINNF